MAGNHCVPHTETAKARMRESHLGKPAPWKRREIRTVNGVELFACGKCKRMLARELFYAEKRTVLGIKSECKECHCEGSMRTRNADLARAAKRRSEAIRRARIAQCCISITIAEWKLLEELWGRLCLKCGSDSELQWDHVTPLAMGGSHSIQNLQRLCRKCNERKQARHMDFRSDNQLIWCNEFKRVESEDRA